MVLEGGVEHGTDSSPVQKETNETHAPPYSAFSTSKIWSIVSLCGLAAAFSTLSAFTYFPALDDIADDLGISYTEVYVSVTVYLVTQGIMPPFLGDLADQIGRRPVYLTTLTAYVAACIGLALQRNYATLIVLRILQSAGCTATVAFGIIVVSDLAPPHLRGKYSGAMLTGPNVGPSLGPIIGGIVTDKVGWWWVFWILAVLGGACLVPFILFFPETSRSVVGNGLNPASGFNAPIFPTLTPQHRGTRDPRLGARLQSIPNPFKCLKLILRKEEFLILATNGVFYLNYSVLQAALATLLMEMYELNSLQVGLCYLPYGIATLFSSYIVGLVMDKDYRAMAKEIGLSIDKKSGDDVTKVPIERARTRSIWIFMAAVFTATLGFGWLVDKQAHISVPLIMTFICGFCNNGVFNNCILLTVDIHPQEPGLASVSVSLVRCLMAGLGVAIYQPLLSAIGPGWTFSVFSFSLIISVPMMLIVRIKGPSWRGIGQGPST